jgi:hypothetical protein
MFSLLSIQLHRILYIERGAKNAMNGKLEYEYFRLQKLEKDVLESYSIST